MPPKSASDPKGTTPRPTRTTKPKAQPAAAAPAAESAPTVPVMSPPTSPSPPPADPAPAEVSVARATPRARPSRALEQRAKLARRASVMLKFVSDPTRLQVIMFLSEEEHHVGALCEMLGQSQPAVSHHLALLRHGGVISPRRLGKNNFYSLSSSGTELARVVKLLLDAS